MLGKMRGLKRKLSELSTQSATAIHIALTRLNHLVALPESMKSPEYPDWARKRLSHHLTDYFLRSNPPLQETARTLAREQGIEEMVDGETWQELAKVEDGLRAQRLEEVLKWTGENRTALKKAKVSSTKARRHQGSSADSCGHAVYSRHSNLRSISKPSLNSVAVNRSRLRLPTQRRISLLQRWPSQVDQKQENRCQS